MSSISVLERSRTAVTALVLFVLVLNSRVPAEECRDFPGQMVCGITIRNAAVESRFLKTRSEDAEVNKLLMNSNVVGTQSTVTETRLRIVPDSRFLRFEFLNSGEVTSRTTGFNPQARVESLGNHRFDIVKPFWFDGERFLTLPAHGTITASQTPQRVVSRVSTTMPLLGPVGDRVAWNEVLRRTPQINRAVAEDVSRDVLPKINRTIDQEFAELQKDWDRFRQSVDQSLPGMQLRWHAESTGDAVTVWLSDDSLPGLSGASATYGVSDFPTSRSGQPANIIEGLSDTGRPARGVTGLHPLSGALRNDEDLLAAASDAAMNRIINRFVPGGIRVSDTQLRQLQQIAMTAVNDSELSWGHLLRQVQSLSSGTSAKAEFLSIEFPRTDALRIGFRDGDLRLCVTFQLHPTVGEPSGWFSMTFNLRGRRVSSDQWAVIVRSVDVDVADVSGRIGKSELKQETQQSIRLSQNSLTDRTVPRSLRPETPLFSEGNLVANVQDDVEGFAEFPTADALKIPRLDELLPLPGSDREAIPGTMTDSELKEPATDPTAFHQAGTVWISLIRTAAESLVEKIPPVTLPLEFDGDDFVPGAPRMRLSTIHSNDGQLRIAFRFVEQPQAESR